MSLPKAAREPHNEDTAGFPRPRSAHYPISAAFRPSRRSPSDPFDCLGAMVPALTERWLPSGWAPLSRSARLPRLLGLKEPPKLLDIRPEVHEVRVKQRYSLRQSRRLGGEFARNQPPFQFPSVFEHRVQSQSDPVGAGLQVGELLSQSFELLPQLRNRGFVHSVYRGPFPRRKCCLEPSSSWTCWSAHVIDAPRADGVRGRWEPKGGTGRWPVLNRQRPNSRSPVGRSRERPVGGARRTWSCTPCPGPQPRVTSRTRRGPRTRPSR